MPDTIIAEWLNLPSIKFERAVIHGNYSEIHLERDYSLGFTCSGCGLIRSAGTAGLSERS